MSMMNFDASGMARAAPAASAAAVRAKPQLSPLAQLVAAQHIMPAFSPIVVAGTVRAAEFILIALIGIATYFGYVYNAYGQIFDWYYIATAFAVAGLAMIAFQAADIYQIQAFRNPVSQCARLTVAWSIVFLLLVAAAFFAQLGGMYSRLWLSSYYGIGLFALYGTRLFLYGIVRRWTREGRLDRRAVVVGGGDPGEHLVTALERQRESDVHLVGVFDDRGDDRAPLTCAGLQKLGTVDDLVEFARRTRVDLVIFSLPISAESRILQMLKKLWVLPVDIRLSAHTNKLQFRPRSYSYIGSVPVLDVFDRPIADWDVVMKWLFDKIVGGLALVAALPVMAVVAIAVRLDSRGPALFKQKRYGFNNELIEVFKFRSMYVEATDASAAKLVTKGDPRVTRVGRFIRKTSLDALPPRRAPSVAGRTGVSAAEPARPTKITGRGRASVHLNGERPISPSQPR